MSTHTRAAGGATAAGHEITGQDAGLLLVRGIIGLLFIGHGTGKLFGWFGQGGLQGTGAFFEQVGYAPGPSLALLAGLTETVGGVLLVLGLFTPLGGAAVIGMMVNAAMVKSSAGFWIGNDGYEYEFVLIVLMVALAIAGPGAYSLDHGRPWSRSMVVRVAVTVVLGFGAGVFMLTMRG